MNEQRGHGFGSKGTLWDRLEGGKRRGIKKKKRKEKNTCWPMSEG